VEHDLESASGVRMGKPHVAYSSDLPVWVIDWFIMHSVNPYKVK
jgi:hypothetical protein